MHHYTTPRPAGGFIIAGESPLCRYHFEVTADGAIAHYEVTPGSSPGSSSLPARPPLPIPAEFDLAAERRRTQQGGCCGRGVEP